MSFREHLAEIRTRLIFCGIALALASGTGFYFSRDLVQIFLDLGMSAVEAGKPKPEFVITTVIGQFSVYFNLALVSGLLLASPVLVYQLLAFIAPALEPESLPGTVAYETEINLAKTLKRSLWLFLPGLVISFAIGVVFAYWLILPPSLKFLLNFADGQIKALPTAESLIGLCTKVMFWSGLVFELPLIMFFLARLKILTWRKLLSFWRVALVLAMVAAAFVNPSPDIVTQFVFAVPIYGLYWLGVLLARFA